MVTETLLFETTDLNSLDFCLSGRLKDEVYKRKVDTREELIARILDAAALIKKREYQLRRTTRDLRTRVAKCIEVEGGIFENSLRSVTNHFCVINMSFKQYVKIKIKVAVSNLSFFITIHNVLIRDICYMLYGTRDMRYEMIYDIYYDIWYDIYYDTRYDMI